MISARIHLHDKDIFHWPEEHPINKNRRQKNSNGKEVQFNHGPSKQLK